ncbi:piggyBac transposable element-derived protein 4-like [Antedon mediterranea]|uniref:piggyBac transposable element-derived protein 4-like n=1 Tax=Antedon mediterranea TaxID=105859 RepID=UPI003AF4E70C
MLQPTDVKLEPLEDVNDDGLIDMFSSSDPRKMQNSDGSLQQQGVRTETMFATRLQTSDPRNGGTTTGNDDESSDEDDDSQMMIESNACQVVGEGMMEEDDWIELSDNDLSDTESNHSEAEDSPHLSWTDMVISPMIQTPTYTAGAIGDLSNLSDELDYFHAFFPMSLYKQIKNDTNNYVEYYQEKKRDAKREWWNWQDGGWLPIAGKNELMTLFGACLGMSIVNLPNLMDYWGNHPMLSLDWMSPAPNYTRFSKLHTYLRLSNPWRDPSYINNIERRDEACRQNPMYKVCKFLEPLVESCLNMYTPGGAMVMKHAMIGLKGEATPNVPFYSAKSWRVLLLVDADTGYVKNIEIYGPHSDKNYDNQEYSNATEAAIMRLTGPLVGKFHSVFASGIFVSSNLARRLYSKGVYISAERFNIPQQLKEVTIDTLALGEIKSVQFTEVITTVWRGEKGLVYNLSTMNCMQQESINCRVYNVDSNRYQVQEVTCPVIIQKHQQYTNRRPECCLLRSCAHIQHMCNTWWKHIFWLLLDISINNAHVLFDSAHSGINRFEFTMNIVKQLMGLVDSEEVLEPSECTAVPGRNTSTQKRPLTGSNQLSQKSINHSTVIPYTHFSSKTDDAGDNVAVQDDANAPVLDDASHILVKFPRRGRNCKHCSAINVRTQCGRRRDTYFGCLSCQVHLHKGECFINYHVAKNINVTKNYRQDIVFEVTESPPVKRSKSVPVSFIESGSFSQFPK